MHIVERVITLDEFRAERFEPFAGPPFGASVLMKNQMSHYVVLDLVGALMGSESHELVVRAKRLIENGERTIVINLKSVTTVDEWGLGELIGCYMNIVGSGGAILLANPPSQFCQFIAKAKFL